MGELQVQDAPPRTAMAPQTHSPWELPLGYGEEFGKKTASGNAQTPIATPGIVTAQNSYLRWEDPVLGINGEGRTGWSRTFRMVAENSLIFTGFIKKSLIPRSLALSRVIPSE